MIRRWLAIIMLVVLFVLAIPTAYVVGLYLYDWWDGMQPAPPHGMDDQLVNPGYGP